MKALIYGNKIPFYSDLSLAFHGFEELEYKIELSDNWFKFSKEEILDFDVCVGGIKFCNYILNKINKKKFINPYPEQLKKFLNRNIEVLTVSELQNKKYNKEKFFKPFESKLFSTFISNNFKNIQDLENDSKIFVSDILELLSEWRVYVQNSKIVLISNYLGEPTLFPDILTIEQMVKQFSNCPCCYTLDVGVTLKNTCLIEINDFYSIGNYGLQPMTYAKML